MKRAGLAAALLAAFQASMADAAPPAPPPPAMHGGVRGGSTFSYPYGPYPYRGSYDYAPGGWYRYPGTTRYYEGFASPAGKYPLGAAAQAERAAVQPARAAGYWYW